MKDLAGLMQQAQQMQARMEGMQAELAALEVVGEGGAGLVKVVMNGAHEVVRVEIDASLMTEAKEVLEDLLAAACNDGVHKVEAAHKDKMSQLAGGLSLPFGKLPNLFS